MFLIYAFIFAAGMGAALWLFINETKAGQSKNPSLSERLGLKTAPVPETSVHKEPLPLPGQIEQENILPEPTPPVSLTEKELQDALRESSQTQSTNYELQEKYQRLEKLFEEKTQEFEKIQNSLNVELKVKKEFHKVKDILEKEIKDIKDRSHKQTLEIGALNAETENYKKRISQLEEKIKSKEQDIKEKEQQISEMIKRIQTFAALAPVSQPIPAPAAQPVEPPKPQEPEPVEEQPLVPKEPSEQPAQAEATNPEPSAEKPPEDKNTTQGPTIIRQKPTPPS